MSEKIRVGIYARCSTSDKQNPDIQLLPLREYCKSRGWFCAGEFVDVGYSGSKDRRPELDKLMNLAKKRQIDCIAVWKLDRWGRSLKHLINSLAELQSLGVSFVSYSENIDMTTPAGQMLFHVIGAMAQFERSIIIERVKAGMAVAKAKGVVIGRKPTPPVYLSKIIDVLENENLSSRKIAKKVNMPRSTVQRTIQQYRDGLINREGLPVQS